MDRRLGVALAVVFWALLPQASLARDLSRHGARSPAVSFTAMRQSVGDLFGVGTFMARRYPALAKPALRRLAFTGADWVREEFRATDLHRAAYEPFRWRRYDRVISAEVRGHLHVLALLDYNNTFNGLPHTFVPREELASITADYVGFVERIVRRYRKSISYWQIWNEPDIHHFWGPYPDAKSYAHLLSAAYDAIKRLQPKAHIVIGGPSGSDPHATRFLHRVVAAGGKFDIVSAQPYASRPSGVFLRTIRQLRSFHKPIWVTEMGWSGHANCPMCGSPWAQASRLAAVFLVAAMNGVARMFWYDFRDDGVGQTWRDHFGLMEWNLAAKPAYVAFSVSLYMLNEKTVVGVDHVTTAVTMWKLTQGRKTFYALWNDSSKGAYLNLRWSDPAVRAVDYLGLSVSSSGNGRLALTIRPNAILYLLPWNQYPPNYAPKGLRIPPGHTT